MAHSGDPAGMNMARRLSLGMEDAGGGLFRGGRFDLLVTDGPAVSADGIDEGRPYGGYVFLSRHAAASGRLALTCHSTGNFGEAALGGRPREVAPPYPALQKAYIAELRRHAGEFPGFHVTLEATHHGPTALGRPSMFVEVGTTPEQWGDEALCGAVADVLAGVLGAPRPDAPAAVCFGGSHYPARFTEEAASGRLAPGTIVPRSALAAVDAGMLSHILGRNAGASVALVDPSGAGADAARISGMLEGAGMAVERV